MPFNNYKAPKLPRELLDKLGSAHTASISRHGRPRSGNRKERRKTERVQKKLRNTHAIAGVSTRDGRDKRDTGDRFSKQSKARVHKSEEHATKKFPTIAASRPKRPDKDARLTSDEEDDDDDDDATPMSHNPQVPLKIMSADDAEIAALEKKLGLIGNKKNAKSSTNLEFGDVLEGLEGDSGSGAENDFTRKRKRPEDDAWLAMKRRKATKDPRAGNDGEDHDSDDAFLSSDGHSSDGLAEDFKDTDHDTNSDWSDGEDQSESESENENGDDSSMTDQRTKGKTAPPKQKVRENPFRPPVAENASTASKYVPPFLRTTDAAATGPSIQLKRQMQGLLNRLSDANILTILNEVEQLFYTNSRQHVSSIIADFMMGLLCSRASLSDAFIILHACFVAAVYKVIGADFGALVAERIVVEFDKYYNPEETMETYGKETINLISFLAQLYNFRVIGSNLIFDYVRWSLASLSAINTEILLRVFKNCGAQLRQDDPLALKDVIFLLQKAVAQAGESSVPVRTKFMIDTIKDLKNNRVKTGGLSSSGASEQTVRLRKTLGTLNTRTIKASEPLRLGLDDIRHGDKRGKWWLVGASWKEEGENVSKDSQRAVALPSHTNGDDVSTGDAVDLLQIAKEHRMNTDIRRAIFVTIMSATDYRDAHLRLVKLKLKRAQEPEIARVLLHCAGAEQNYNPYYTLIAQKLCSDHRLRMTFQFSLWDIFKRMGERDGEGTDVDDDYEEEKVTVSKIVNWAKMFGTLIAESKISLAVLKVLNFAYLRTDTKTFLEVMLTTTILSSQRRVDGQRDANKVADIMMQAKTNSSLAQGLQHFLNKVVSHSDIVGKGKDRDTIRWACKVAIRLLALPASQSVDSQ